MTIGHDAVADEALFAGLHGVDVTVAFEGLPGDEDRLLWAFEQFEAAGLELGSVHVAFFEGPKHCRGGAGLHFFTRTTPTVVVCNPNASQRHRTLLHELAHVWVGRSLSAGVRTLFLDARGLTTWCGSDVLWGERGTEHAAEIVAWGLSDHPCWEVPRAEIGDRDMDVLAAQFVLLTGTEPRCDAGAVRPNPHRYHQVIE